MAVAMVKLMEITVVAETNAKESKWWRGFDDRQYLLPSIDFQKHTKYVLGSTATNFVAYIA